jgi:BirA family biotin operon repressor/biotin-[acetyl-CoA-carboxylase] ligase
MTENLTEWAEHLEGVIEAERLTLFDRVFVLSACASTQDAARRLCGTRPGAVVIAGRQTAGRGRLGREWVQKGGMGIAMTFVLPEGRFELGTLSIAAGVAAAEAAQSAVAHHAGRIGLRWPNDVVCRESGRKVAGVLIERSPGALVGVGMNVLQKAGDWPVGLADRAYSLAELGSDITRLEVACRLMVRIERALSRSAAELANQWAQLDTLMGVSAEFAYNNTRYQGVVEGIDPSHEIVIRAHDGARHRLPCLQTSLLACDTGAASRAK